MRTLPLSVKAYATLSGSGGGGRESCPRFRPR
jgi:hypothetical protein